MTDAPSTVPPVPGLPLLPGLPDLPVDSVRRPGAGGSAVYEGLTFGLVPGFRPLLLDLHVPAGSVERGGRGGSGGAQGFDGFDGSEGAGSEGSAEAGRRGAPVVVWIHGGGFRSGDRRYLPPTLRPGSLFEALTAAGIAVATIDYRLSREAVFPAQLDDVRAAVAYLRAHAAELGIDPSRLGVWGESAGGTLAALAGLDPAVRATAVVGWYTVADLRMALRATDDDPIVWLLGGQPSDLPELAAQASPVVQARPDAPAFLLVHGDSDQGVPWQLSEDLHRRLIDEGNASTLRLVTGADHCFEGYDDVDGLIAEAVAFFVEQLAP